MNFHALFAALAIVFSIFTLAGLLVLWVNFVVDRYYNNVIKQVILIFTPVATALTIVIYSSLTTN
tara:strand:- start:606 stop:800 length:195 start_codon:yes stop_codon:yes gene_type:complete